MRSAEASPWGPGRKARGRLRAQARGVSPVQQASMRAVARCDMGSSRGPREGAVQEGMPPPSDPFHGTGSFFSVGKMRARKPATGPVSGSLAGSATEWGVT